MPQIEVPSVTLSRWGITSSKMTGITPRERGGGGQTGSRRREERMKFYKSPIKSLGRSATDWWSCPVLKEPEDWTLHHHPVKRGAYRGLLENSPLISTLHRLHISIQLTVKLSAVEFHFLLWRFICSVFGPNVVKLTVFQSRYTETRYASFELLNVEIAKPQTYREKKKTGLILKTWTFISSWEKKKQLFFSLV